MHIHACTGIYLVPRVCNTLVQWNIGNGEPWPIPQTMVIQTLEITLGFSLFENGEWTAWLLDVHAASLPWAVGCGRGPACSKTCQSLQAET